MMTGLMSVCSFLLLSDNTEYVQSDGVLFYQALKYNPMVTTLCRDSVHTTYNRKHGKLSMTVGSLRFPRFFFKFEVNEIPENAYELASE